jgi:transcription antitermination protein NusB
VIKNRRKGREMALKGLYMMEVGGVSGRDAAMDLRRVNEEMDPELVEYADRVLHGYAKNKNLINQLIDRHTIDWDMNRLATVDLCLMRIAVYELLQEKDIPPAVTIDEAIELAKKYSTSDSSRFINGVLGNLLHDTPKANWTPPPTVELEEQGPAEPDAEVITEEISEEEAKDAKVGFWKVRRNDG